MGAVPDLHEPGIGYILYPCGHALVSTHHLLIDIQIPYNNLLMSVRIYRSHHLGKCVEDNLTRMSVMDGDGQEVKAIYSGFIADADVSISVFGCHVRFHIERYSERTALLQNLCDALQVRHTDETSIAADNTLRT